MHHQSLWKTWNDAFFLFSILMFCLLLWMSIMNYSFPSLLRDTVPVLWVYRSAKYDSWNKINIHYVFVFINVKYPNMMLYVRTRAMKVREFNFLCTFYASFCSWFPYNSMDFKVLLFHRKYLKFRKIACLITHVKVMIIISYFIGLVAVVAKCRNVWTYQLKHSEI